MKKGFSRKAGAVKYSIRMIREHPLTVGGLKKLLDDYDDDVQVGVAGYYDKSPTRYPRCIFNVHYQDHQEIKLLGYTLRDIGQWGR